MAAADSETESKRKQVRVVAWVHPRSCSSALTRAMWNKSSCKTILEPYGYAYYTSEERVCEWFDGYIDTVKNTKYADVKRTSYEMPYLNFDEVFVKDMAGYPVASPYDLGDLLPHGYVHTFLIRSPEKAIKSLYQIFKSEVLPGWKTFRADRDIGIKQLWVMYNYVKEHVDPNPLVIVGEDLMAKPETVLRHYCERTGLKFEDSMIHWRKDDGMEKNTMMCKPPFVPFFEAVFRSDGFTAEPPVTEIQRATSGIEYPPEVHQAIAENQVYYEQMLAGATRF